MSAILSKKKQKNIWQPWTNNTSSLPSNQRTVICLKGDLPGRHKVITALLSLLYFN